MKANLIIKLISAHSAGDEILFKKTLSELIQDELLLGFIPWERLFSQKTSFKRLDDLSLAFTNLLCTVND